jgi:hypothetical protein
MVNMLQGLIFFFVLGGEVLVGSRIAIGRRGAGRPRPGGP